jgi:hypothetical protein
MQSKGAESERAGALKRTYNSQLRITQRQLLGMPYLGWLTLQSVISPSNPALRRRLPEIDLLSLMPARVSIEQNPDWV